MAKTAQEFANDLYKELCAQLKDLEIRIEASEKEREKLRKRIDNLNDHVPLLHQIEERIRNEVKEAQDAANCPPPTPIKVTNLVDNPS